MKQTFFSLLLLLAASFPALSQEEKLFRVNEHFSFRAEATPAEKMANGFRVIEYTKDSVIYQVLFSDGMKMNTREERFFRITLEGIRDGYTANARFVNYSKSSTDTLIGGAPGKFMTLHNNAADGKAKVVYCFASIQDEHPYIITASVYRPLTEEISESIRRFFAGLQFTGQPYPGFSR